MSSVAKGDKFEAKVFALLKREAKSGHFFARSECCKFFQKKGYYSNDRKSNIVFDISIEIFMPGQNSYSILILVECKDYSKRVPVDDAEEFFSKIEQVSGAGAKGIIVSTNSFSQGAFDYCQSKGIGLARYYDTSTLKWDLLRSPSSITRSAPDWVTMYTGLVSETHRSQYFDFYGYSEGVYTNSLYALFRNLIREFIENVDQLILNSIEVLEKLQSPMVEFVSPEMIEEMSEAVLRKVEYSGGAVLFDKICKWQSAEAGLCVKLGVVPSGNDLSDRTLGRIKFDPLEITIYDYADGYRGRQRFTLAHELGHHLLGHAKYMTGEHCEEKDFERDGPADLGIEDIHRMEWQANYFASCLLLPREKFIADFSALLLEHSLKDRGYGLLFVDEQVCNQHSFYAITDALRYEYDVSRRVVEIRLRKLGLLNDTRTNAFARW